MARTTVLVDHDEEDLRAMVTYDLTKKGHTVVTVVSVEDALAAARTKLRDAVVLYLMLPGRDGLGVCRHMETDPTMRHVPAMTF
jgi:DNA-binding response OmpR family regulator